MISIHGYPVHETEAVYEDHVLADGRAVWAGRKAYRILVRAAHGDGARTQRVLDVVYESLVHLKSLRLPDIEQLH